MHQEYFKTEQMIDVEKWTSTFPHFHEVRRVSMAANIVDGHLIVGSRHFCPIMNMQINLLKLNCRNHNVITDQGFVDQWGIYMSREEAYNVAEKAGQIIKDYSYGKRVLYSESYL